MMTTIPIDRFKKMVYCNNYIHLRNHGSDLVLRNRGSGVRIAPGAQPSTQSNIHFQPRGTRRNTVVAPTGGHYTCQLRRPSQADLVPYRGSPSLCLSQQTTAGRFKPACLSGRRLSPPFSLIAWSRLNKNSGYHTKSPQKKERRNVLA